LVGAEAAVVFAEVVEVFALEAAEEEGGAVVPGDLEVDEVGAVVVAEEDVLGFIGVDVGDASAVELGEEGEEFGEEVVGDGFAFFEGATFDEGVEESGGADAGDHAGDVGEVVEFFIDAGFAVAEAPT